MDKIKVRVTKKVITEEEFYIDLSLGRYNQLIEEMYDDETEFNELEQNALQQRKMLHLKKLRK